MVIFGSWVLIVRATWGRLWNAGKALYFYLGGFMDVYICKNSLKCTLRTKGKKVRNKSIWDAGYWRCKWITKVLADMLFKVNGGTFPFITFYNRTWFNHTNYVYSNNA